MEIKKGTIKRIHVNKHIIASNLKRGRADPAITIQTSRGSTTVYGVDIHGKSRMIYSPNKPLSCGARIWLETTARVETLPKDRTKHRPASRTRKSTSACRI